MEGRNVSEGASTAVRSDAENGIKRLLEMMRTLRSARGCPWDREQTLESLKPCLIEETYEVIDAIDSGDAARHMEELGDLLLQLVFQTEICEEQGRFRFEDVVGRVCDKLVRRHPHVFGGAKVSGTREVLKNWEAIKAKEDGGADRSLMAGLPRHLPALQKAQQVQMRAARVGFDWSSSADVVAKLEEETREVRAALAEGSKERLAGEIGDLLFTVVNLARFLKIGAEDALESAVRRFVHRFGAIERSARERGKTLREYSSAELDELWESVKNNE